MATTSMVGGAGRSVRAGDGWRMPARWAGRVILAVWAVFWTWFGVAVAVGEGWGSGRYAAGVGVLAWGLVAGAWRWPRVGGVVAVLVGIGAVLTFRIAETPLILGGPLIVAGLLSVASASRAARNR